MDYTVTLTVKDLEFRKRARTAGIPSIVVSMYAGALQRLVEDEREECAKFCDEQYEFYGFDHVFAAGIRARGEK
jgi:hypothetical protein